MDIKIRIIMGCIQIDRFIPEFLEICKNKKVTIEHHKFKRINLFQGELTGVLNGDNANYVMGWIEGYGKAVKLNKPVIKKLAPAK